LEEKGILVHKCTVCRQGKLEKSGLEFKSVAKMPLLNEIHKANRESFCKKNFNRDWKKNAFSDSKYFVFTFSTGACGKKLGWAKIIVLLAI
jgi:hypothetical protein